MHASSRRKRSSARRVGRSVATAHSLRWRSSVSAQALDQLGAGVIVADADGRVVEMNRAAEAILRHEDGLVIRNDRLRARRAFETAKAAKLIADAAAGKAGTTAARMLVERSGGPPAYVLTVVPLSANLAVTRQSLAMIVVVDPGQHTASEQDLAELFGLSPAEARLTVALLAGRRLSQIADSFGVRVTTLRTQLASILRKVGVDRQLDLVRQLSGIGIGSASLFAGWLKAALLLAEASG